MLIARHQMMLSEGVPEWVHLLPAGEFRGVDGRGPYRVIDPQAVITASMAARELPIDENHATYKAAQNGGEAPARGWIVEMQAREDGIWGRVRWTDAGTALMTDKSYRGLSPEFSHTKDGNVLALISAALTNRPNLAALTALHTDALNPTGDTMDLAALRAALGLPDTADEAAILAAASAARTQTTAHSQQLSSIATAIGLAADAGQETILTTLQTQRGAATDVQRMAQQVTTLETQIATMRRDQAQGAAVAFVDAQIRAGKPINSLRDHYIARHVADAAAVEREIGALPVINAGGMALHAAGAGGEPDGDEATPTERMVAQKMGVDPKKLVAARKAAATTDGRMA